ncbi:MAG TPA: GAF domain-containing protein [Polyangiaceae bacterium]|jgi:hypothetical protein|nr:GAF domain-containing protein [Polyangiaceae bacterium]
MRWFVEVSRVGESGLAEKYCVEAKQWQAALQEARKLRGDSGALSKFSIELLDDGYRAVDPALKLRYFVNKAPGDAPLTEESGMSHSVKSNGKHPVSIAPTAFAASAIGASEVQAKPTVSNIPRPGSHSPPRPTSVAPPRPASNAPPRPQLVVPDDPVPRAPRTPAGLGLELQPVAAVAPPAPSPLAAPAPVIAPVPVIAPAPAAAPIVPVPVIAPAPAAAPIAPVPVIAPAPAAAPIAPVPVIAAAPLPLGLALPAFDVVRERGEEPRADSPITYREVAYAVKPGTSRAEVEALLWARYKDVAGSIEDRPTGKFVQLAVFDHAFQKRPERAPLATFAWKDWRGSPVLAFPGFGEAPAGPISQVPPSAQVSGVSAPAPVAIEPPIAAPMAAAPEPIVAAPEPLVAAPEPIVAAPVATAFAQTMPAPVAAAPIATVPAVAAAFEITFDSKPLNAEVRKSSPDTERQSRPRLAAQGRRRAGEDLIGELFEFMHELHFMADVAAGAEFVLSVLNEVLPSEGVLIHVFDINTNHFVVVRAHGPNAKSALLQRMSDQDPLALLVMRSPQAISIQDAANDPRFNGPRWQTVGVAPKSALCGAVRQGGRYLGLVELVNPAGDAPFHQSEVNALDYICEQFAEFLSNRPIILAADVILARI